jgi:glycosyltransferase involved in cell wall biosynthesis
MKILFIIESLRSGGKERRLVSLIDGLVKNHQAEVQLVLLSTDVHYKGIFDLGITIHNLRRNIIKDPLIMLRFFGILKSFAPDIVHCWDNIASAHFSPLTKSMNIKFVNSMITSAPPLARFSKKKIISDLSYPFSDVILSNSKAGLEAYKAPKNKSQVIHNGFDFNRINSLLPKIEIRKKYDIPEDKKVIGMVASFTPNKDYDSLLNYALALKDKYQFLAVGDGPDLEKIKVKSVQMGLNNILFLGRISDVESVVNLFDIAVLISNPRHHGEGISNAIMEYMALSKLVIASDNGGNKEIVIDGETGFLMKSNELGEFMRIIDIIEDNEALLKTMGCAGRKRLSENFNLDSMVNSTYQLYKDLCGK